MIGPTDRRQLMQLVAGLGAGAMLAPRIVAAKTRQAPADTPTPPVTARDARLIWARLVGDLSGRTVYFFTHGTVWGFKPQADDLAIADFAKQLYGYSGVVARKIDRLADGHLRLRQKGWAFYRDPLSDAISDRIPNPYTGAVDRATPLSGPVSDTTIDLAAAAGSAIPYGIRVRRLGRTAIVETSAFHRFRGAGSNWYKLEGNLEEYVCATAELDDPSTTHVPSHYHQNVIAEWQTWTGMHGTPGHILFNGHGEPLRSLEEVPADQIAAIERFFPGTLHDVGGWR